MQVASNLVENALRETPAGGTVIVRADGGMLVVADTGPGIPPEDQPRAFERFYLYDKIGRDRLIGSGAVDEAYLEGCYLLGDRYPDLCASVFTVCSVSRGGA